jgi:hypothetical protein
MRLILVHLHVSAQCRWFYPGISPLKWIYVSLKLRDDTSSDYLNMEMMIINLGFPHNCQTHSFSGWPLSKTKQKKLGWLNSLQGIMNGKDRNQTNQTNQRILKPAPRLRLWRIVQHLTSERIP